MAFLQRSQQLIISCTCVVVLSFALILNIIGTYLLRKQGIQRTHQNLIIIHLSMLQIPAVSAALVFWTLIAIGTPAEILHLSWIEWLVISVRIPLYLVIATLTFDRLCGTKYSLRYRRLITTRKMKTMMYVSWVSWISSFSTLFALRSEELYQVLSIIAFPLLDWLLLLFIMYTYCYIFYKIRKRPKSVFSANRLPIQRGSEQIRRVSTTIIFFYVCLVLLPDFTVSIAFQTLENNNVKVVYYAGVMINSCYLIALPITYVFMQKSTRSMFINQILNCFKKKDVSRVNSKDVQVTSL